MADETQDVQTPDETPADNLPPNKVTVEQAGEVAKKITIEVNRQRIDAKYDEMFGELRTAAVVPGFRKGHAPRRLLEKRFGKEVGEDVRNALVSESLAAAVKDEDLKIIGEPDIKLDEITIPETGSLVFSLQVEVQPEFDLPEYKSIAVAEQKAEITEDRLNESVQQFLANRGVMAPVQGPAKEGDTVVADVSFSGEGIESHTHENEEVRVAPSVLEGVPLEELGAKLAGAEAGGTVTVEATVPQGHPTEAWRGKAITFTLAIKEVKRLEVPPLTDELAAEYGFEKADQMREYIRGSLQRRAEIEARQAMYGQIADFLLNNTKMELPAAMAERQTASAVRRRYLDLLYRGIPREQIERNLEMLQAQAGEQARRDLKLSFILDKIAGKEGVTVEEGEINARIAQMASQYGRRPERLRTELANEGTLDQVQVQIREGKTMDKLLEIASITKAEGGEKKSE